MVCCCHSFSSHQPQSSSFLFCNNSICTYNLPASTAICSRFFPNIYIDISRLSVLFADVAVLQQWETFRTPWCALNARCLSESTSYNLSYIIITVGDKKKKKQWKNWPFFFFFFHCCYKFEWNFNGDYFSWLLLSEFPYNFSIFKSSGFDDNFQFPYFWGKPQLMNRTLVWWLECSPMAWKIWVQSLVESY